MNRRSFLKTSTLAASLGLPAWARAAAPQSSLPEFAPTAANGWRSFELTSRIEAPASDAPTQVWVPLPSVNEADWSRVVGNSWQGNAKQVEIVTDPKYGATMLHAQWAPGTEAPVIEVASRVVTRDRGLDLTNPGRAPVLSAADRTLYTHATKLLPTDGIVLETARKITQGATTDVEKARAIYDWIVDNTFRNPKTRGCGLGDIRTMLETGDLSGKCADLNALYVGLARSLGIPARDVYGIRVADSRYGYKSLGKSGDVSKAQHCRAEVWLSQYGWVPIDPADVRKVALEEPPGGLPMYDPKVVSARKVLFGAWEMNWLAYNFGHDLALPGSEGPEAPYLMYPQGEGRDGRFDSLDPAGFRYTLTSKETTGA
ncbi:transglutaminase family protein [Azoarcus sp. KH32C]|uniref:transglutaminase-like domain-containing protein n=1 Tax=Azoarcus sp. KH32C TaxID=748247 RepID=UPI00023867DA|nr:transglutaminase domain-containing protein [Azoarcus sp. KH32C]BAL22628.1 transglutaminase domain-containing protein [Azoarcus sp. KH32C]